MADFFIKDELRAAVEFASGGKQTVLYNLDGNPSLMNIIPAFTLNEIVSWWPNTIHPAFQTGFGNQPEIFVGTHLGVQVNNTTLLSVPGVAPTGNLSFDQCRMMCANNGHGWHMMTKAEQSALALWMWRYDKEPGGNNFYGLDVRTRFNTGKRVTEGMHPGIQVDPANTYTGTGPSTGIWNHDGTNIGIADMAGNMMEWVLGCRLVGKELQLMANNDAALITNHSTTSGYWQAMRGDTGALTIPTFTGTIASGNYTPTTTNSVRYDVSGNANYTLVCANSSPIKNMTNPGSTGVSSDALNKLTQFGCYRISTNIKDDIFLISTAKREFMAVVGGSNTFGVYSGVHMLVFQIQRSEYYHNLGARPCYVNPNLT